MRSTIIGGLGLMLSASTCLAHGYGGHPSQGSQGGFSRGYASQEAIAQERAYIAYSNAIGAENEAREVAVAEAVGAAEAASEKSASQPGS